MLTVEEFTAIADAKSEEEKKILCGLHGINYDTFSRLWPIERFGRDVLAGNTILLSFDHMFQANPEHFDLEVTSPRMTHSLRITYVAKTALGFFDLECHESTLEVNWLDVTPSLERAILKATTGRQ